MKWVFVYGTLRPGDYNHRMFGDTIATKIADAKVRGTLYHVAGGSDRYPIFPVADLYGDDWIVGDLLYVDETSAEFEMVNGMEVGAGYVPNTVYATVEGTEIRAVAYHYLCERKGPRIISGDWFAVSPHK